MRPSAPLSQGLKTLIVALVVSSTPSEKGGFTGPDRKVWAFFLGGDGIAPGQAGPAAAAWATSHFSFLISHFFMIIKL